MENDTKMSIIHSTDLAKIEIRVGTIIACQDVETSRKLYKLTVDLGEFGTKIILAGVRNFFTFEELIGKQGIFVCNLEPRAMAGLESQGMMLFAQGKDNSMSFITVSDTVPNGSYVR